MSNFTVPARRRSAAKPTSRTKKKKLKVSPKSHPSEKIGSHIATYRSRRGFFFSLLLPGILGVLTPLGYGFWRMDYAYANYGPVAAVAWSRPWFQLATLALVIFGILAFYRLLQARRYVSVHKMGVRLRLQPFSTHQMLWEEIDGVSSTIRQDHFLTLRLRSRQNAIVFPNSGSPLFLGEDLENLPELISRLKAGLYPRLLPRLKTEFEAGKWLYFGPIAIDKQGMHIYRNRYRDTKYDQTANIEKDFLNWERIEQLTVHSGALVVELRDQSPKRIPVSRIPNLELLLQIIQQGVKV